MIDALPESRSWDVENELWWYVVDWQTLGQTEIRGSLCFVPIDNTMHMHPTFCLPVTRGFPRRGHAV
jgi:hypothetical protein